ncbi:pyridoxal-phosphate dependent enzyme [Pseudonocardia sp. WMMC193]|uniref:pyridoxal-phosphate dependent enzyme n=1 Tax=Pseudonocardia sp. WMMC193 TaxID=2911965 RepID=UPI001F26564E|nr:pyridoxal-phosphate dependent enzyme [Pseudonocardia sp. WMMC193]MCF7550622.1 pyridoxal-phosphate dependent enzyme [Pseudonocardia sp. WMMC193]
MSHDGVQGSVLDLVGNTPLVRLRRLTAGLAAQVLVKLEYLNPGGSVKDRAALEMVRAAEAAGLLRPGSTIVEGTSGNTGTGLAQAAAVLGYRCLVVLPNTVAVEKVDVLRAYGAEIVQTRSNLPREHPEHVMNLATRLAAERPGGWLAHQYDNPANPAAHRRTTGPEIWAQTGGRVTHLVSGIGTGGTITGTGAYLKEVSGGRVTVVGADPATSVYHGGDGSPFLVEAAGHYRHPDTAADVWPLSYDPAVVDRIEAIPDRESVLTTRRLAAEEGILVGGSSGLAVAAALRTARGLGADATVVAILPDSGRAYLSKYHSTDWLRRTGFLDGDRPDLLAERIPDRAVVTVTPDTTLRAATELAAEVGDAQPVLPVVLAGRSPRFPTAGSEILGALDVPRLRAGLVPGDPDAAITVPPGAPVTVGTGETVAEALARTAGADVLHVLRDGRLAGVLTRASLTARPLQRS